MVNVKVVRAEYFDADYDIKIAFFKIDGLGEEWILKNASVKFKRSLN